ncbi:Lead, cadmium, zinc and mercury transporting ATPase; Copper-translocating P-type ATPase [hydrothermal vent metagenome]|uniref:Lead, cadmium, zinc and mercury transporting ATPase Copper-translocating P-type ATPase n=1 Tax=hydrothermal vent metagenome TaxID=652676 RepID=A0A3B1AP64_9ZZZZ
MNDVNEITDKTATNPGLSSDEAARRLAQYGPNALKDKQVSVLRRLLGYFWGPIPWMIEIAAILSALVQHWADFWIIMTLLMFNAAVGFWQEYTAGNAVAALMKQLALKARVRRDDQWQEIDAQKLVPGDIVRIRLGDVIPADVKLVEGDYLSVDQSALTGESLPVTKRTGDDAFSGTVVKQGEVVAEVSATGANTRFGKTATLVQQAKTVSHFQKAVLSIGDYLIYVSLALVAILIIVGLHRGSDWLELVQFALILTVASIPVAMPAVLSMTMAMGAMALSKRKAIVTRLESIEEMASMDILCSDKTGTLTQNRLTLGEIEIFHARDEQEVLLAAAQASREEDRDAIDDAVLEGLKDKSQLTAFRQTDFIPFDPVHKRTEATIQDASGSTFQTVKGAPQVIMEMTGLEGDMLTHAQQVVDAFAQQGYRALGVARRESGLAGWQFLGIISLFDPPREDSATTIAETRAYGVGMKMVTGDNLSIAKQIAEKLGLGSNILRADALPSRKSDLDHQESTGAVENADGFAEVFPEHKFEIVKILQRRNHITGMTGDGVNDAPALKQADVGIAVSGATDAARAAADLVLTAPGLSVITHAIEEARRIFERMNAYAIYRISETIRIMFFVVLAMIFFDFYPITAIMIILLAFFNDVPIMTIAYDHTGLEKNPVRWNMHQVITVATVMGIVGVVGSFGMLLIAMDWLHLNVAQIQTYVFLKMAIAGHLVLFVARTKGHFWERPWPAPIMIWSAIITKLAATLLAAYGFGLITPITWPEIALIWGYSFASALLTDWAKVQVYRHMSQEAPRHRSFLVWLKKSLHVFGRQ